jgi:ribose transport system ATP-binding protein
VGSVVLKIENVSKSFPGVQALDNVSMELSKGEVRGIIGENGAGKSTLITCIMGVQPTDTGNISILNGDTWVQPKSAIHAKNLGMFANYQHVNIAKELSVGENYFLGKMPVNKFGAIDWKKVFNYSKKILEKFSLNIDPHVKIRDLPIAMQEMVTISKISVNEKINLVIFDEPTALLENEKVQVLYNYIRELKANGICVLYISHRLEEILEICDTVSVMKDGKYVDTKNVSETNKENLVSMMVGRDIGNIYNIKHQIIGDELLRVEDISYKNKCKHVSFSLRSGEILGFFGLVGAGRTEVMRSLFGAEKTSSGEVFIKGQKVKINSPTDAMKNGIGYIPEDRREQGLALPLSVKTNINMSSYSLISKAGIINLKSEAKRAEDYKNKINIKTPTINAAVMKLSGGNQQKVVISKLLCLNPDIFIFDEPTIGIDVGAKQEIYRLIEALSKQGKGIIVISSYLPEVIGISDRILIMSEGEIVGEMKKDEIGTDSEQKILKIASRLEVS